MSPGDNKSQLKSDSNPCAKEMKLSYRCLEHNLGDGDQCGLEFENYKRCKRFWLEIVEDRKRKGIRPLLPKSQQERDAIRLQFQSTKR